MYIFLIRNLDYEKLKGAVAYGLVAFFCVLFMLWFVKYVILRYFKLKDHGVQTKAEIIENKDGYVSIKYRAGDGGDITAKSSIGGFSEKKYSAGGELDVYYDPDAPNKFVIKGHDIYMRFALAAFFGVFFVLMTFACLECAVVYTAQFLGYK